MELIEKQLLIQHASSLEGSQYLLFGYTMDHYTEQIVHSMSNRLGFSMSYYQTPNQLYQVMRQYEKIFALDGIQLKVEPEVMDLVVDTAIKEKLGARGLRAICERIMTDAMYDAPSSESKVFDLTLDYARTKLEK